MNGGDGESRLWSCALLAAAIVVATANCAPALLVQRESVFERTTMADVDALALRLLPRRVRDCGVQNEPRDLPFTTHEWPAVNCISAALAAHQPFVVRYRGMTMDSGTVTAFCSTRDVVYRVYKDTAGPFTLERCPYDDVRVTSGQGVTCRQWLLIRDMRR